MRRCLSAGLALCLSGIALADRIEINATDFASTRYLDDQQLAKIRQSGFLTGDGEADYPFSTRAGWYELWVEAAPWPTDLYLDGTWTIHTPFASGVWSPVGNLQKVMNLELAAGRHTLRFSRPAHPGLPWMRRFVLKPASDITGRVRITLREDHLCFRRGEPFPIHLSVGHFGKSETLALSIQDTATRQAVYRFDVHGSGDVLIPTNREGVFDLRVSDGEGRPADRVIQYLVIDTTGPPVAPKFLEKVLVQTIDCSQQTPDYSRGETRVADSPAGVYRESGDHGNVEFHLKADWFAYTLKLPSIQDPYLIAIDYPDDDERTFTYAIVEENMPNGRALAQGVASGGTYSLSNKLQTAQMVFYPSQRDPRLVFRTWRTGQRAGVAAIRVYRVTAGFPELLPKEADGGREFGRYEEEPLQFAQWGAQKGANSWQNLWDPAEHAAQYSRYVGVNLWQPTIAVYRAALWPSQYLPSFDADAIGWTVPDPLTLKDPLPKDTVRLMLLASEKYGVRWVGELFMSGSDPVMRRYLEGRFRTDKDGAGSDPNAKPWLAIPRSGAQVGTVLYNPLHPGVEAWTADIVRELAERYRDSPAFAGIALRLMGWQFSGWQGFPSIDWGYDDSTISQFEGDTGVKIPVDRTAPDRFERRFDWLMANAYEPWVKWRCAKIYAYHMRLAKILTDVRPDLKLYLDLYGPSYGQASADVATPEYDSKGWTKLLRETGIDPTLYRSNPSLVLRDSRAYPPGIAVIRRQEPVEDTARIDRFFDPIPLRETSWPAQAGKEGALHFDARSFESNMLRANEIGFKALNGETNAEVHGAALVFPAGRHFLDRYANSMADGNLVSFTEGSHGYIMQPPEFTRAFMAEYRRLPEIGMRPMTGDDDPVAGWYGGLNPKSYFYLVNRCDYSVTAWISFPANARVRRLTTGEGTILKSGVMRFELGPYELQTYQNLTGADPLRYWAAIPPAERQKLAATLAFVDRLLNENVQTATRDALVPDDWRQAASIDAQAHAAWQAGRFWSVHRLLLNHKLVKIYQELRAWPPELFYGKNPPPSDAP